MRRIFTVAAAMVLSLILAVPAGAAPVANRAFLAGELCDSLATLSGLTDAEIQAFLNSRPDPGWDDDEGDFDGDGDEDARDERVRRCAWAFHDLGIFIGTTGSTFDPHDPIDRDAAASVFKRIIFLPGPDVGRNTLYSDVGAVNTHSCNIHLISDIDQDGLYGDTPYIIQGYPPVPSKYKPDMDITEPQIADPDDGMVARLANYISTAANPFRYRNCGKAQPRVPLELGDRIEEIEEAVE